MPVRTLTLHATCAAIKGAGDWHGVLLRGSSGSGKSDLALRLIDEGGRLLADDQVVLTRRDDRLMASSPPGFEGRMEVRGVGIVTVASIGTADLALVVDLVAPEKIIRMPEPASVTLAGVKLPLIQLAPFEISATAKIRVALDLILRDHGTKLRENNA